MAISVWQVLLEVKTSPEQVVWSFLRTGLHGRVHPQQSIVQVALQGLGPGLLPQHSPSLSQLQQQPTSLRTRGAQLEG